MPTVACAKCSAQLRIPDGATGKGKCPKCGAIFVIPARPAPQPAFEVVEDEPMPAAKPAAPAPATPAKPLDQNNDVLPRGKRQRDDDEDDRPRKKRPRDDDYDDEDDRPRGKRQRDDDEDDEEDDWKPAKKADPFGSAVIGAQLFSIGLLIYAAMFAVLALYMLIRMFTTLPEGLFVFPALAGITMTVLTIIGASFGIAGPTQARGLAIATVTVSAMQIIFTLICFNEIKGLPVGVLISGIDWLFLGTTLWILDMILPLLIYMPQGSSFDIFLMLSFLAAACELARMILILLTLKAYARRAEGHYWTRKAGLSVIVAGIVCGAAAFLALVAAVIVRSARMIESIPYVFGLVSMVIFAGYAFMALLGALVASDTRLGLARKARKG